MRKTNILIVDDKPNRIFQLRKALKHFSEKDNLDYEIFPKEADDDSFSNQVKDFASPNKKKELLNFIKKQVSENNIHVIVLDFYLNGDKNDSIDRSDGYSLLMEIRGEKGKISNIPIFGYTQGQKELEAGYIIKKKKSDNKDQLIVAGTLQGFIEKSDQVKKSLKNYKQILYRIQYEGNKYSKIEEADILVISALKKEIEPVIKLLKNAKIERSNTFAIGYIIDKNRNKRKVVAITEEQMGMAEAATLTTQMIEKYSPKFVVMTGIAAGINDKQKFLDVLIPTHIYNWQSGKYTVTVKGKKKEKILHEFQRNFDSEDTYAKANKTEINMAENDFKKLPEYFLRSEGFPTKDYIEYTNRIDENKRTEFQKDIAKLSNNEINRNTHIDVYLDCIGTKINSKDRTEFQKEIVEIVKKRKELESEIEELKQKNDDKLEEKIKEIARNDPKEILQKMNDVLDCKLIKEGMVSGSAVVADGEIVHETIAGPKVSGIDMEAYGVTHACNRHPKKPEVLIIKAICDFADGNKNDIYQSAASYVSAQAFYKLFTEVIDTDKIK